MTDKFTRLALDVSGEIAELRLTCPDLYNRIDGVFHSELTHAFEELHRHPHLRAVLFSAEGKHFSAGGDMELMVATARDLAHRRDSEKEARRLFEAASTIPVPVVAAMQGDAIGLGATMILCCDAVVASRNARIADPHVVIGLAAGDGGCVLWPQAMGFLRAKRYLLTGDRLTAAEAHAMGLVTDLVDEPGQVLPAARALAERIAALPPLAVQGTKRALNRLMRQRTAEAFDTALHAEMDTFGTDDLLEAVQSFKERRSPRYRGA